MSTVIDAVCHWLLGLLIYCAVYKIDILKQSSSITMKVSFCTTVSGSTDIILIVQLQCTLFVHMLYNAYTRRLTFCCGVNCSSGDSSGLMLVVL